MVKLPFRWVVAAAGIMLVVSPEARKRARALAVKSTELMIDVVDEIRSRMDAPQTQLLSGDDGEKGFPSEPKSEPAPADPDKKTAAVSLYESAPEPVDFKNIYNVVNDDVIRRQVETIQMTEFGTI
jgi:hypothetical protein